MTKPNPFTAGQVAYTAGKPCKPPATLHGADQVRWLSGWRNAEAAQRLSDGMRTVFAIARVNAVLMRHSTVRGWIPYTDMELEEAFS